MGNPSSGGFTVSATVTRVAANASSVQILAANNDRRVATVCNNSTQKLYLKFGTTAVLTSGSEDFTAIVQPEDTLIVQGDEYNGRIDGIWGAADATGEALITETVMASASL